MSRCRQALALAFLATAGTVSLALADPPATGPMGPQDLVPPPALYNQGQQLAHDPAFDRAKLAIRMQQQMNTGVPQAIGQQGSQLGRQAIQQLGERTGQIAKLGTVDDQHSARYALFVSQAMGPQGLRAALDMAKQHQDMVVLLRGVNPGQKLLQLIQALQGSGLTKDPPLPNIELDPVQFRDHGIVAVPTLEKLDDEGRAVASVRGVINPQWIDAKMAGGGRGDLGKWGSVVPISEVDLIEAMKAAASHVDVKAAAQKGYEQYWSRQTELNLPAALHDRTRLWDPSVQVNDGITAPDGTVIAYPGQRVNPMDVMPFTLKVFIFDARDPRQVAVAQRVVAQYTGDPNLMLATVADDDWPTFQAHAESLHVRLYQANAAMIERFGIQALPSLVTAGPDKHLQIREFALTATAATTPVSNPGVRHVDTQSSRR